MTEDSSSGNRRSKRQSSSRRISTQRERNDDDEYDYRSRNDGRSSSQPNSHSTHHHHHHSSSSGRHRHSHRDDGSSKRSSKSKQTPIATATPARKVKTVASAKDSEDNSTVSSLNNDDGKPSEKWHQKTWVRILLGFLVIFITVIITFFVLRATGLGLDKTSSNTNANVDLSNAPSAVASGAPSSAPTPVPFFTYAPPDEETCDKKSFETGDTSFVNGKNTREFEFTFDVTLSFADSSGLWVQEFLDKVNSVLIPILVGCPDDDDADDRRLWSEEMRGLSDNANQLRRPLSRQEAQLDALERLQKSPNRHRRLIDSDEIKIRYVVDDAAVTGSVTSEIVCPQKLDNVIPQKEPRQGLPEVCFRLDVYVDFLLRGEERVFSLVQLMSTILIELSNPNKSEPSEDEVVDPTKPASLLESMKLRVPFKKISVVGVANRDPTKSPSTSPSQFPTNRPSVIPTNRPSISPTLFPTNRPSMVPSHNPTDRPTPGPTPRPTTPFPSKSPTLSPTTRPSLSPSKSFQPSTSSGPTIKPTVLPTCADFWEQQDTDNVGVVDPNDPPDTRCESLDENN